MRYEEFLNQLRQMGRLDSNDQAENITHGVLETLGERLDHQAVQSLLAQLPEEMKSFLLEKQGDDSVDYDLTEFYNRVSARAGLNYFDAAERTWQVMFILQNYLSVGERERILECLPGEFEELFGEQLPNRQVPRP